MSKVFCFNLFQATSFPSGSDGKEYTWSVGDLDSIPGLGRFPGGYGNPFQYSCLENPHGQRSLESYSPWGHRPQVGHNCETKLTVHPNYCHFLGGCFLKTATSCSMFPSFLWGNLCWEKACDCKGCVLGMTSESGTQPCKVRNPVSYLYSSAQKLAC